MFPAKLYMLRLLGIKTMIRIATLSDYDSIHEFDPFSGDREEDIREGRVFIYLKDGVALGFLSLARSGLLGRPYVQYLSVNPVAQRNGVASSLLSFTEEQYDDQRLFISTESDNDPMNNLLSKRQYKAAGGITGANLNGTRELYYYRDNA